MTRNGQRRKPAQRAFRGLAGSPLAIREPPEALKKQGRPPKHDRAMTAAERKAASREKQKNDAEIERLIAEQKIDDKTGGRYGPGLIVLPDRLTGVGPSPRQGRIMTGERIILAAESKQFELDSFGGRKTKAHSGDEGDESDTPDVDLDDFESEEKFQRRHHPTNWTYDRRDKQEIARQAAPDFIEVFDPRCFLRWDVMLCEFVPWDAVRCKICNRVFGFLRHAVEHIVDIIDDTLIRRPEYRAEVVHNLDITRHRRAVLKGITAYQPVRTKKAKLLS